MSAPRDLPASYKCHCSPLSWELPAPSLSRSFRSGIAFGRRIAEMERVSETLHLPVKIQWGRPNSLKSEPFQKLDLLFSGIAAQESVVEKLFQPRFHFERCFGSPFDELESLGFPAHQPTIQDDLDAERLEVDVPGLDQRIQERDAILVRYVEDIRIQELENADAHLFITAIAESSEPAKPTFITWILRENRCYR